MESCTQIAGYQQDMTVVKTNDIISAKGMGKLVKPPYQPVHLYTACKAARQGFSCQGKEVPTRLRPLITDSEIPFSIVVILY